MRRPVRRPNLTLKHIDPAAASAAKAGKFTECGNTYALRLRHQPRSAQAAHLMFNAAVCYEWAHKVGPALMYYQQLVARYPRAPFAPPAQLGVARIAEQLTMYRRAARALNEYIRRYHLAKPVHYKRAMRLDVALGDKRAAMAVLLAFARNMGAKHKKLHAELSFMVTKLLTNPARRAAHLSRFVRLAGRAAPLYEMIAHAMLGAYHWQRSCPRATNGLCMVVKRIRGRGRHNKTCAKARHTAINVRARNAIAETMAQRHLTRAVRLHKLLKRILPTLPARVRDAANLWAARAQLYLADKALEAYLQLSFPKQLNFNASQKHASSRRFATYLRKRKKAMARLNKLYQAVGKHAGHGAEPVVVTAAARIGLMAHNFSEDLVTGDIPTNMRTGPHAREKLRAYCTQITTVATSLRQAAARAYSYCVAAAARYGVVTSQSRACEAQQAALAPKKHVAHTELLYAAPKRIGKLRTTPGLKHWQAQRAAHLMQVGPYVRLAEIYLSRALTARGNLRRRNLGMASKNLMSAVAIAPNHPRANALLGLYTYLHPRAPATQLIVRRLRRVLQHHDRWLLWNALGLLLTKLGKNAAAARAFARGHAADFNLGLLWLDARNYAAAASALRRVVEKSPNDVGAHTALGIALAGSNKFDAAEKQYKAALAKNPRARDALFDLGVLYDRRATTTNVTALRNAYHRTARAYYKRAHTPHTPGNATR